MKKRWLVILLGIFALCCILSSTVKYRDENVTVGDKVTLLSLINVHGSYRQYLKIKGRTFLDVRGFAPCYVRIPQLDAVFFVTKPSENHVVYHVFNLKTDVDLQIDGFSSLFGARLGLNRTNGILRDYIKYVDSNRLIAVTVLRDEKISYVLDLAKRRQDQIIHENYNGQDDVDASNVITHSW